MGNTSSYSCIPINRASFKNLHKKIIVKSKNTATATATLFDTDGSIREIKLPMKSAELMIQHTGHVISPVEEIRRTRRITALKADAELIAGKVYLLVPVSRVNSKASEVEIAIVEGGSGKRKGNKTAKVSPATLLPENNDGAVYYVRRRRWNPVLDPILESS